MKTKEETIKHFKRKITPINEVIKDKKLVYFVEKMMKKAIKEHKKTGFVKPETMFVIEKEDGSLQLKFHTLQGDDKETYFSFVHFIEKQFNPKYLIAVSEGYALPPCDPNEMEGIYEKYGCIENHPEHFDTLDILVKTNQVDELYSGMGIVEDKKISPINYSENTPSINCNFTSFSSNA